MSLLDRYRPAELGPPKPVVAVSTRPKKVSLRERLSKGTVEWSEDFQRILTLPRRPRNNPEEWSVWADQLEQEKHSLAPVVRDGVSGLVRDLTEALKRPEGTQTLREVQALLIWEAMLVGGVIGMVVTGGGKTLPGMLLPMAMPDCKRAVYMLPPSLRQQFAADWESYSKHWILPNLAGGSSFVPGRPVLHVLAYSELSHAKSSALLDQIDPDLVIGDEISSLRNFGRARVTRFTRFFAEHPRARFCGWDATLVANSIENFWHLLATALGSGSPMPIEEKEVHRWARALDPSDDEGYFMPGVLEQFCEKDESPRSGFRRRLISTQGVVVTEENLLGIPLIFRLRKTECPENIAKHLRVLRRKTDDGGWKRPDGEELTTPVAVVACARQLAEGCWLYFSYPRGETKEQIDLWFGRRQAWNRELRAVLLNPRVHMDSPLLCENAAKRWFEGGCPGCDRGPQQEHVENCRQIESHPLWRAQNYLAWIEVEDTVRPVTKVKWESEWLLEDAAAWAREAPGIVWVDHPEFGHRLSSMTGFAYYGGGEESAKAIIAEDGSRSVICSVEANKKGRNLQAWSRNLIIGFPSSNDTVDQLCGRTYRELQKAPQVTVDYYLHTPELEHSFDTAVSRAHFVFESAGQAQKLVYARFEGAA